MKLSTKKCKECKNCEYFKQPFVQPELRREAKIMFVGEAPWTEEVEHNGPFKGHAGKRFDKMLAQAHESRANVSTTNSVKCLPFADKRTGKPTKPSAKTIALCTSLFLNHEIVKLKPRIIVPMGDTALKATTNKQGGNITNARGFLTEQEFIYKGKTRKVKVLPTFHPQYVNYRPELEQHVISDFVTALAQARSRKILKLAKKVDYKALKNERETVKYLKKCLKKKWSLSLDIESTGLDPRRDEILCLSITHKKRIARVLHFYTPWVIEGKGRNKEIIAGKKIKWAWSRQVAKLLYKIMQGNNLIIGQNFKFDLRFMDKYFANTIGKFIKIWKMPWREVIMESFLLDENIPHDLKSQAHMLTDIRYTKKEIDTVKQGRIKFATLEDRTIYASKDTDAAFRLDKIFVRRLKREDGGVLWKLFKTQDMPMTNWSREMELFGIHVNPKRAKVLRKAFKIKIKKLEKKMYKLAGGKFSIGSTKELPKIMFEKLKIRGSNQFKTKKTGTYSTDKNHMEWIMNNHPHPFVKALQEWRQYTVFKRTFIDVLINERDENDVVHTEFLPWGTKPGRLSSRNPNMLNTPRDKELKSGEFVSIRRVFTARKGHRIIDADYSQIEFKIVAIIAEVLSLIKPLMRGEDFHLLTARAMFGKRMKKAETIAKTGKWKGKKVSKAVRKKWATRMATMRTDSKTFNFALMYMAGNKKLAKQLKKSIEKVAEFRELFFEKYPEIGRMIRGVEIMTLKKERVQLPNGRFRRFPKVHDNEQQRRQARQAFNAIPQGTAGYIGRDAVMRICARFVKEKIRGFVSNTVYDSIIADVHRKDIKRAKLIMVEEMLKPVKWLKKFIFTIKIGVGKDWAEAEHNSKEVTSIKQFKKAA